MHLLNTGLYDRCFPRSAVDTNVTLHKNNCIINKGAARYFEVDMRIYAPESIIRLTVFRK